MSFINDHLKPIKPYRLVSQRAWQDPERSIKLDWNESTIPPSPLVMQRIIAAFQSNRLHWYPDIANTTLNEKLADYCGVSSENILYFSSSDSAHEAICRTYLSTGDRVFALAPTYDHFRLTVEVAGALFVPLKCHDVSFNIDLDMLGDEISTAQPKLVYLCNPNNPTGTFIEPQAILRIISSNPNVLFLVDEAYIEFYPHTVAAEVKSLSNLLVSRTMSKAFGLAGFRFGYISAPRERVLEISILRNPKNVSTFAQIAAEAALDDIGYMNDYVTEVNRNREKLRSEMDRKYGSSITTFPSSANFMLLRFESAKSASTFCERMAANNIFVRGLAHLGGLENYVRITIGTADYMNKVLEVTRSILT